MALRSSFPHALLGSACFFALLSVSVSDNGIDGDISDDRPDRVLSSQSSTSASGSSSFSSSIGSAHGGAHAEHIPPAFDPVTFLLTAFTGSILTQQLVSILPDCMRPPHSVVLYSLGMFLNWSTRDSDTEFGKAIRSIETLDAHTIFWVFLPMLLYEDAASSDWHVVRRVLPSAMLLALPGVVINTFLTALLLYFLDITDFKGGCLLGSILSATDPVAVIGALNALQAPPKLSSIIAGESLLNDGSAVVIFSIFKGVAAGREEFSIWEAFKKLLRLAGGGVALGLGVAFCAHVWLAKTRNFSVEILLIVVCIFGLFFAAEHEQLGFSGVLAVVTFGFFMAAIGKSDLAMEKEHEHHAIVNFLAYISNECIFIIAGIIGYTFSFDESEIVTRDWLDLFFLYIGVHFTRGATVGICYPILHHTGYRLNLREAIICVVGGLRGAVGLALALLVLHDHERPTLSLRNRQLVAFHTNGIVLGTLFVNGIVVTPIYKWLEIQSPTRAKHHHDLLKMLLAHADELVLYRTKKLKKHWFFADCHQELLDKLVPTLSDGLDHAEEDFFGRKKHALDVQRGTADVMKEIIKAIKDRPEENLEATFQSRLALAAEDDKHDRHNIFQAHYLLINHAKEEEAMDAREMEKQGKKKKKSQKSFKSKQSNKSKAVSTVPTDKSAGFASTSSNGSAVQTTENLDKTSSWSRKEEETKQVLGDVQVIVAQTEINTDGVKATEGDEAEDDEEESDEEEEEVVKQNPKEKMGRRIMAVKKFVHFKAFKTRVKREDSVHEKKEMGFAIEIATNLVNAQRAAYKQMYETGALNENSYQFLSSSLDFQVEAIDGDLKNYNFLTKYKVESTADDDKMTKSNSLHLRSHWDQLHFAQRVSFAYIKTHMDSSDIAGYKYLLSKINHRSRLCEWILMRRNVKTLLAYVMVLKQNKEELEHLKEEYYKEVDNEQKFVTDMIEELGVVEKMVKEDLLMQEVKRQPVMFKLYEHVLFARLVVVQQKHVLKELTEEGNLEETDVENFIKNITDPSMKSLERWNPSKEQLANLGGEKMTAKYIPALDVLVKLVNELTMEPI